MKYKITAPNSQYNGVSASVVFVSGVGETDSDHLAGWFEAHGYTVEDQEGGDKPLSRMNKAELLECARGNGLDVSDKMTKNEIIKLIETLKPEE